MSNLLTHSRLACFRACHRRHYFRYELGLVPDVESYTLRVGSAFARAVEAQANGLDPEAAIAEKVDDPFDLAVVAAMFNGHETRWQAEPLESVAAELPFEIPLVNPETGRATTSFTLAGKIDRIVKLPDGRVALMEYKTTSRDFSPGADYWTRLHLDRQLSIYMIAARALGYDISTVLYDVTRRPALRPLKATPVESRKFTKDGKLYAAQRENDEEPAEYAARVAKDIAEKPDHYFARIEIARLDDDLTECAGELWDEQLQIREAQKSGRWSRNPDACFGQTYRCEFLNVCQRSDLATATPEGFKRITDPHPELATVGGQAPTSLDGASRPITE